MAPVPDDLTETSPIAYHGHDSNPLGASSDLSVGDSIAMSDDRLVKLEQRMVGTAGGQRRCVCCCVGLGYMLPPPVHACPCLAASARWDLFLTFHCFLQPFLIIMHHPDSD